MDHLWEKGWRHFGPYFYRYSHAPHDGQVCSVMPLRINLEKFKLSRSQKRILKRNADLEVRIRPAFVNSEVVDMFERHKERFVYNVPDTIYTFVSKRPSMIPCDCKSLCVYLNDKLIGISYLDVGREACSSVYQCFEPTESRRSLGVLMILYSLQYAREKDKTYYYPGYAYEESSHYDYKKKFAGLEHFDWKVGWRVYQKPTETA